MLQFESEHALYLFEQYKKMGSDIGINPKTEEIITENLIHALIYIAAYKKDIVNVFYIHTKDLKG